MNDSLHTGNTAPRRPGSRDRVILVGDDHTADRPWHEWLPGFDITVDARRGDTADLLEARLPEIVEQKPDIVILLIGANDLRAHRSVEHVVRSIEHFLTRVRAELPGVRTLVQSLLPAGPGAAHDVREANRHLRQYSTTLHAQYLDLWPALATEDGQLRADRSEDGVRVSAAGYAAWLTELRPALDRLRAAPPMTSPTPVIRDL